MRKATKNILYFIRVHGVENIITIIIIIILINIIMIVMIKNMNCQRISIIIMHFHYNNKLDGFVLDQTMKNISYCMEISTLSHGSVSPLFLY